MTLTNGIKRSSLYLLYAMGTSHWEEDFVLEKSHTMQQELLVWIWKLQVQATIFTAIIISWNILGGNYFTCKNAGCKYLLLGTFRSKWGIWGENSCMCHSALRHKWSKQWRLKDGWSWKEGKRLKGTVVCGLQKNKISKAIFILLQILLKYKLKEK